MKLNPYLKPFVVWVTGLWDSYRNNPFVRTTVDIILLQLGLSVILIGTLFWAVDYTQVQTVSSIAEHIEVALDTQTDPKKAALLPPEARDPLPQSFEEVRDQTLLVVFICLVFLTALFGFLIAAYALRPARRSLQFQKRFIGNVAHEIRTPLATIKTNTEVALLDPGIPKDVRKTFEETVQDLDRISEIINNLLSFDLILRPGRMKFERVNLAPIIETVVRKHEALARSRDVKVVTKGMRQSYTYGNTTALEQVVTNLVKNAINYSKKGEGRLVVVKIEPDREHDIAFSITDQGIGIAEKDLEHIFEPFYRGDAARTRGTGTGSSGLGLAIVNEIVRMHHGRIGVQSVVGKGTSIRISLPVSRPTSAFEHLLPEFLPRSTGEADVFPQR